MGRSVLFQLSRYTEDHTLQFSRQFFFCFSGKLAHIAHIYAGFFRDGHRQCFACRIHSSHCLMGLDGPLGEHIRLALQLSVLVDNFQRTEQVIGRIICIGQPVCTVVDETVFGRKAVIKPVQFLLFLGNGAVWNRCIHLKVDQFLHTITQSHKTFHAGFGGSVEVRAHHAAVFPVVHLPVYNGIGIVLHIGVSRNGGVNSFAFAQLRQLCLLISAMNILHSIMQLVGKLQSLDRVHGVIHTMSSAYRLLSAQHHFRVVDKIPVDGKPILRLSGLRPFRHDVQRTVPLLEKDDVRYNLGTGILFERVIRQTDSSQQLGTLGKIAAHGGILGVHGISRGHKSYHTAGTHLIQCFGKKIVMNTEIQLVVGFVVDLILTERHITNGKVIEISPVGGLKPGHGDVGLGVELLCNPSTDGIQLNAIQTAVSHFFRQHTEEIAHTHRRLQNISGLKSHTVHRFIDGLNDRRAGVMGVEGRASGGSIFFWGQQLFQLGIFRSPCGLLWVKGVGQTAPAHISRKNLLLFGACLLSGSFQLFQQTNRIDICLELGFRTALTQMLICNAEVFCIAAQVSLVFLIRCFLGSFGIGKGLPLAIDLNGNRVFIQHFLKGFLRLCYRGWRLRLLDMQLFHHHIIR